MRVDCNACNALAKKMRIRSIHAGNAAKGAHFGGTFSLIEIMVVLYGMVLNYDIRDYRSPDRDRLILSKGHGVLAQYAALVEFGFISEETFLTYRQHGSRLTAHPHLAANWPIEFTSGSLGQGLSLGVGTALALARKNSVARTFVILGDGECNEGQVWEAACSAAHYGLNNLVAIVDKNGLQYDGSTDAVLAMPSFEGMWQSFGWSTQTVDGHNTSALYAALSDTNTTRPKVVIANTIKGKGVSFMEGMREWHHATLSKSQYELALSELHEIQNGN